MEKIYRKMNYSALAVVMLFAVAACGGGSSSPSTNSSTSVTYSTTSNRGDYSEWTLAGSDLNASWEVVNGTGGIDYVYTIVAICGAVNANNIHSCTISSSDCTNGAATCPPSLPSGSLELMEVPGVALLIHTTASSGGDELHAGFVKNASACSDDISGDYSYIRTGVGLQENFGMFRADSNLINIVQDGFGFNTPADTAAAYSSTMSPSSQTVAYRSSGSGADTLVNNGCSNGLRQRTTSSGEVIRAMMTASGLFVLDLPAGQGGLLAFRVSNAASLSDFANKSFAGFTFPDDGSPTAFYADTGAIVSGKIDLIISLSGGTTFNIMPLTTASGLIAPAYADFTTAPAGYSSSSLATTYPTPNDIPGLFKFGKLPDSGRVITAAMKFNNKVIALGMVYNYRDNSFSFTNPSTGSPFTGPGLYNSGNFILFEK